MNDVHGRTAGQDNVEIFGMDINSPVFVSSGITAIAFIIGALVFQENAAEVLGALRVGITTNFDWVFMITCNVVFLFCLFLIFSPLGRVRFGGPDAVPEYSRATWFAMLFSSGVAIGLLFYGVLEPVYYMQNPPLGIDPSDIKAAHAIGISATTFHWGFSAWALYAAMGLGLAFFSYSWKLPLTIRSVFYPILGDRVWGWSGHLIDTLAVFATLFGLATSLGLGAEQATAGLNYLFGIPATNLTKVVLIVVITGIAVISVLTGLNVGIKRLSQFNMILAGLLLLFVLVAGPTLYIFHSFFIGFADYLARIAPLSNWIGREDTDFLHGWTTFYWAWWISWTPFVGIFIARISKGRTVREFLIWVLVLPTLCSLLWMSVFGGTAIHQFLVDGYTGVTETVAAWQPELVLFKMLEQLPLTGPLSFVSIILVMVFFVTSSDSGSLVADTISAGGKLDTPVVQRVFWCSLEGAVAIALLLGGGLQSLQAASIITGLPFAIVLLGMTVSVWMGLRREAC